MNRRRVLPLSLAFLLASMGLQPGFPAAIPSPADDAFHFSSWAGGPYDAAYTEWWYFNFFDTRAGVQAIFSYFVTNPADIGGGARVQLVAVAYTAQGVVSEVDDYPRDAFSASGQRAGVTIGETSIQAGEDRSYRVAGASRDGRLSWDLAFTPQAEPWFAADRMTVGSLPWEKMSWLVFMPRALVTGRLVVDGRAYEVDAPGYHDHNWGEWIPTDALWNWAQFSDGRLALELGDFIGKPAGVLSVDFGGQRTVFTKGQYWLLHTRWALDGKNRVWYPTESLLLAGNDTRWLWVTIRAVGSEPLRGDLPLPLPDVIVYEQTARYDGWLWQKNPQGEWVRAAPISGNGFKEYTAKHF